MHWNYLKSLLWHKWYVYLACRVLGVSLWRSIVHDWTKFLPCEWFPYAYFFYGPKLVVGSEVCVNCMDGFGGIAEVTEVRNATGAQWKVRMIDGMGKGQEFWAHDFEVEFETGEEAFNRAWNHHQKANDHHWQYWLLTMDSGETLPIPMPEMCIREMVADWCGAGRAYVKDWTPAEPLKWWQRNKDRIKVTAGVRDRVEELLELFAKTHEAA